MSTRTLSCLAGAALLVGVFTLWSEGGPGDEPGAPGAAPRATVAESRDTLDPVGRAGLPDRAYRDPAPIAVRIATPDGDPVAGAGVDFLGLETMETGSETAGVGGDVQLPRRGMYCIRTHAPGFVRRVHLVALADGSRVVLAPAGSLEIRLPRMDPAAAAEIEVELLPPLGVHDEGLAGGATIQQIRASTSRALQARASASWNRLYEAREDALAAGFRGAREPDDVSRLCQEFDRAFPYDTAIDPRSLRQAFEGGRVRFEGLPAGPGYRYVLHASTTIEALPPNEAPPVRFNADGTISPQEGLLHEALSGVFAVPANDTVTFALEARTPGSVFGILSGFDATLDAASVALRHWEVYEHPVGGLTYASGKVEHEVEPSPDGSFVLESVRAGTKRIQIRQVLPGREIAYVVREFQLAPGEQRDLGVLEATGASITCTIGFVTPDGERCAASEVCTGPESAGLAIQEIEPAAPGLADYLHVPLGAPFTLRGLVPGRYRLKAFLGRETVERIRSPYAFDRSIERTRMVDVDGSGRTEVAFDLLVSTVSTRVAIVARDPRAGPWTHTPRARFVGDSRVEEVLLRERRGPERRAEVWLSPGPYRVVCNVPGDVNLQCVRDVVIPNSPECTLDLDLVPGVHLSGRLRNGDGGPVGEEVLQFALQRGGATVFWASTDAEGRYELSGVEPGCTLWARTLEWQSPTPIRVSDRAGRMTVADLTAE